MNVRMLIEFKQMLLDIAELQAELLLLKEQIKTAAKPARKKRAKKING